MADDPEPVTPKTQSKSRGAVYLISGRILSLFVQLFGVAFCLGELGKDAWGACMYAAAIGTYAVLADVGFGDGGWIYLSRGQIEGKEVSREQLWRTHITLMTAHAIVGALVIAGLGFVLHFDKYSGDPKPIFLMAGSSFALLMIQMAYGQLLSVLKRFSAAAYLNMFASVAGNIFAVVLIKNYHQPVFYFAGMCLGSGLGIIQIAIWIRAKNLIARPEKPFEWSIAKDFVKLGVKNYPSRVLGLMSTNGDSVMLKEGIGEAATGQYSNCRRIPDGLGDINGQLRQAIQADLAAAHVHSPAKFAEATDRYSRIMLGLSMAFLLVPCSCGAAFLAVWLGNNAYANGALVVGLMGLYRSIELCYGTYGAAMTLSMKPQYLVWPVMWNGVCTVLFTIPMARAFGIEGIAYMNVSIHLLQMAPLVYLMSKKIAPGLSFSRHLTGILSILGCGVVVSLLCYWIVHRSFFLAHPFVGLFVIPFGSALVLALIFGMRLAPLPDPVVRRMAGVFPRLAAHFR